MKKTINLSDFRNAFQSIRPDNFSYEGLEILFNHLEEVNPDYDLDVIELCCDFEELEDSEILEQHNLDSIDEIHEHTMALAVTNSSTLFQSY